VKIWNAHWRGYARREFVERGVCDNGDMPKFLSRTVRVSSRAPVFITYQTRLLAFANVDTLHGSYLYSLVTRAHWSTSGKTGRRSVGGSLVVQTDESLRP
jgi:hypothetical protein